MTPQTAWSEGLALLPQHFQNADQALRDALFEHQGAPGSRGFGFTRIDVDETLLESTRQIALNSYAGVLPGGIRFDSRVAGSPRLSREMPEGLGVEHESIRVFLAMPAPSLEGRNVGDGLSFVEKRISRADDTSSATPREIPVLLPNLSLRFSTEPMASMLALPVAEIVRDRQGRTCLARESLPLLLDIHASTFAQTLVATLSDLLRSRLGDLERQVPPLDPAGIRQWLETLHLRTHLSSLQHLAVLSEVHPERLHELLASLWGGLAFVRGAAGSLPSYEHASSPRILPQAVGQITELLRTQRRETNLVRALTRESGVLHSIQVPAEFLASGRRFWLAVSSSLPTDQLAPALGQHAKVAPRSRLQAIITSALPGIEARLSTCPDFFRGTGQIFFELSPASPLWQILVAEGALCVYTPPALSISTIELLVEGA